MPEEIMTPNSNPDPDPAAQSFPSYEDQPPEPPPPTGDDVNASPSASPRTDGARTGNQVKAQFGTTEAGAIIVGDHVSVTETFNAIVQGSEEFSIRAFSVDHCDPISEQREQELIELVVAEEDLMIDLMNVLHAKRFLILAGEQEIGKQTLALHLSHRARLSSAEPCRSTLLVRLLQRRVRLELQKVAEAKKEFGQRVVIFPQIGESENRDLLDLFARLKAIELGNIIDNLRQSDSFFLCTVDTPHIKSLQEDLRGLGVLREIPPVTKPLLERGLDKKVARMIADRTIPPDQAQAALNFINENKELLLECLPKMSQLTLFIERYLLRLIGENQELDLRAAIDLAASPEKWLMQDLGKDFEAWCFVFTLGLCLAGAESEGVPWLEFEIIRREITKCLGRELRMWRQPSETPFSTLLAEQTLLEKCRAQIVREAGVGDLVRFADRSYPTKLWCVFTSHNHRILTLILPVLRKLAQQSGDTQIRARAARMLGRMGEINPTLITLPIIRDWVEAKPLWQKATVGYLYEGIFASPDESYRQMCGLKLEQLAHGEGDELWAAIAVYKQMGQSGAERLALAIAKLGEITERNFTEWLVWEKLIEQQLADFEQRKKKDLQELFVMAERAQTLKELRKVLNKIYDKDGQIMLAICYSLVALSLQVGTFAVMVELNKWLQQGRKGLAALTSWIFWMEEGIADRLAKYRMPAPIVRTVNGPNASCHPVVVAVGLATLDDPQAISQTARFMAATYNQFYEFFPTRMRQYLRKKFLLHLKNWADNSWLVPEYRQVMKDLYVELLLDPQADLVKNLKAQLKTDPEFTGKAHLKRFSEMVLQSLQDRKR